MCFYVDGTLEDLTASQGPAQTKLRSQSLASKDPKLRGPGVALTVHGKAVINIYTRYVLHPLIEAITRFYRHFSLRPI